MKKLSVFLAAAVFAGAFEVAAAANNNTIKTRYNINLPDGYSVQTDTTKTPKKPTYPKPTNPTPNPAPVPNPNPMPTPVPTPTPPAPTTPIPNNPNPGPNPTPNPSPIPKG